MTIRLESINKSFGDHVVLKNVSCEFPPEQISTILGISGCGKTTLLRIIAGLEDPDSGEVYIDNIRETDNPPQERNLGMVFQDLALYSHLTVEKNLLLPLLAKSGDKEKALARVKAVASRFGIDPFLSRRAALLSGGEAQRVALGRAIIREPRVVLLDEPFSHLDAPLQREARQFVFSQLRLPRTTTVLVTHNHQDAQEAGGSVFFLDEGRIVQSGNWAELYQYPVTPRVAQVVSFLEPVVISGEVKWVDHSLRFLNRTLSLDIQIDQRLADMWRGDGGKADLFFRPESLLASYDTDAPNKILGTVTNFFWQGATRFCRVAHVSNLIVEARCPDVFKVTPQAEVFIVLEGAPQLLLWPTVSLSDTETVNPLPSSSKGEG